MKKLYKIGIFSLILCLFLTPFGEGKNNTPELQPTNLERSMLQELEKDSISFAKMKQYFKMGARLEVKNEKGSTPLILAAYNGNYPIAKYLVEKGANVNVINKQNYTPLMFAVSHQHVCPKEHLDLVKLLVLNGAKMDYIYDGQSILGTASLNGHIEMVKFLINNGADVNGGNLPPLFLAAYAGNLRMMDDLIQYGADINKEATTSNVNKTPLTMWAILTNNLPVLSFALNHGANPNAKMGGTALLHMAITNKLWKAVELLVLAGADINTQDEYGDTPLLQAVTDSHFALMKYLIEHGADVNLCNNKKQTPLFYATNPLFADYLKKHGATLTCSTRKYK